MRGVIPPNQSRKSLDLIESAVKSFAVIQSFPQSLGRGLSFASVAGLKLVTFDGALEGRDPNVLVLRAVSFSA